MIGFLSKTKPNRRYLPRRKTRNLVLVFFPKEARMFNLSNLSESGAQIVTTKPLRRNKVIDLTINLAELNQEVVIKGRVIWSRLMNRHSSIYHVGVAFVEISQDAWTKLRRYMLLAPPLSSSPTAA